MGNISHKYKTIIDKLLDLELSIKRKYDELFSLEFKHLKNTPKFKCIIQEIRGLKHFEKELLKELPKDYSELEEIIKKLKHTYFPLADDDLSLIVPRIFPYSNYMVTRLVNKLIYYVITNFENIIIKPLFEIPSNVDDIKLKDVNSAAFITAYNNYLKQDIVNIQIIINQANTNPFIKPQLKKNFYDSCYALPYLEEKYLSQNFEINLEYTITSDIIPSFYSIGEEKFNIIKNNIITKLCLEEIVFMSSQDIYELEPDRNLFAVYYSQSLVQASLLIANANTLDSISCITESLLEEDSSYEAVNHMIRDIFTNVENNNISLSRVQFRT